MHESLTPAATRVRYLIVAAATAMSFVLYLHRTCLSFASMYIKDDLGLTEQQVAGLLSAFFWAYALAQVPAGWLGDRFGVRPALTVYILLWSAFTGLMGAVAGFLTLLALRLGCGLAQAGAYPTSASLISRWIPFAGRGMASGIVSVGGRLGGAVAPVLTAYLLIALVPGDTPADLTAGDLLQPKDLAKRLFSSDGAAGALAERLWARLPSGALEAARDLLVDKDDPPSPEAVETLTKGLNEALGRRDLVGEDQLKDLPVAREALQLGRRPREELTPGQVERLNRLVLEAAFPDEIKKLYVRGWRPVMVLYGLVGVLVGVLFWVVFRDRPREHPWCNAAEAELIEGDRRPPARRPARGLPLAAMVRSPSLGLISLAQFMTNFGWVFLVTWLPRYLAEVHQVPVLERGWMSGVPLLLGMGGMLAGGWVTDRLTRAIGVRWGRGLPLALTRFAAMAAFLACLGLSSPWGVTLALAVVAIATDLGTPAVWAYKQDVGGPFVGSILGWGNMWGNLGAAVSPLVLNAVISWWGWDAVFVSCALAFLVAGVASLWVDARVPIAAPEDI